jgi:hypothetical protein
MTLPFANRELAVQFPAIAWLKNYWGYEEVKSGEDDDTLGSPIDSLGLMGGRTLLVEVKRAVCGGMVRHNPTGSGSIEGKVARTLKGLHEGSTGLIFPAIRSTWKPSRPPVFVLLAHDYTERGLQEATDIFQRRASEWLFDYRIWQWTGSGVEKRAVGELNPTPGCDEYGGLRIPILPERSNRRKTPPLQEHREEANARGVGHIFDYTVGRADELGYMRSTTRSGIRLRAMGPNGLRENAIGIYIKSSSRELGMNFGFYWKRIGLREEHLAGCPAPKIGPLNIANRYISTIDEAEIALGMFAI